MSTGFRGLLRFLWIVVLVGYCHGSCWLMDAPSRSAAWYYGVRSSVNYEFRNINCGGVPVKIEANGTRNCGMCGDPVGDLIPRPNEYGGDFFPSVILTRFFEEGTEVEFSMFCNVPYAGGFHEFRLCPAGTLTTQDCLDQYLLELPEIGGTQLPAPQEQGLIRVKAKLPAGLTCNHCVVQWRYKRADSQGCDEDDWCGVGRGPQMEYYNCADVMIGAQGSAKPDYIQDPRYTSEDYGSAYDTGDWNHTHTTHHPLSTVPTTASTPSGPVTTPRPFSTASPTVTTQRVVTVPTPSTTTSSGGAGTGPPSGRLPEVVITSGDATVIQSQQQSNVSPASLALLLGLLPLIGAASLRGGGAVPPPVQVGWLVPGSAGSSQGLIGRGSSSGHAKGSYGNDYYGYGNLWSSGYGYNMGGYGNVGSVVNDNNLLNNGLVANSIINPPLSPFSWSDSFNLNSVSSSQQKAIQSNAAVQQYSTALQQAGSAYPVSSSAQLSAPIPQLFEYKSQTSGTQQNQIPQSTSFQQKFGATGQQVGASPPYNGPANQQIGTVFQQPFQKQVRTQQQLKSGFRQTGFNFQQPGSAYQQSGSAFQQPGSGFQQPGSAFQQPGSAYQQSGSAFQQPGSAYQQPGSAYQQPGPAFQQRGPAFSQGASSVRQQYPGNTRWHTSNWQNGQRAMTWQQGQAG